MTTTAIFFGAISVAILTLGILDFINARIEADHNKGFPTYEGLPVLFIILGAIGLWLCLTI